jgi:hypothetical protein
MSLLAPLKMPIDKAVELLRDCIALVQGHDLRRVCQFYLDYGMLSVKQVPFTEFVDVYIREKRFGSQETKNNSNDRAKSFRGFVLSTMKDPNLRLMDIPVEVLNAWTYQKTEDGEPPKVDWIKSRRAHLNATYDFAWRGGYWPREMTVTSDLADKPLKIRRVRPPPQVIEIAVLEKLIVWLWERRSHAKYEQALYCVLFGVFMGLRLFERTRVDLVAG